MLSEANKDDHWPRWVASLPDTEYHDNPAISSTFLKAISLRTPAHAKAQRDTPMKETPALLIGRAVHCSILEPDTFDERFLRAIEGNGRLKAVREARAEQIATNPAATILSPADFDLVESITESMMRSPLRSALLTNGRPELSGFWDDPDTGLACRCRPDYLTTDINGRPLIVDLKTAVDASPDGFARALANHGYPLQQAAYLAGHRAVSGLDANFVFLVIEKSPPHAIAAYQLDETATQFGVRQYQAAMDTVAHCMKTGAWPAYSQDVQSISLPDWAFIKELHA